MACCADGSNVGLARQRRHPPAPGVSTKGGPWIAYPCHTLPEGQLGRMRDCPSASCDGAIERLLGIGDVDPQMRRCGSVFANARRRLLSQLLKRSSYVEPDCDRRES
jgi:hypothetical protein